jgi:hypothetical protein
MNKGLYLEVMSNGSKYFRMKYRYGGKEKRLALGVYPETGLKLARDKRDEARKQLAQGIDPSENRKAMKAAQADRAANSFEVVAWEWYTKNASTWVSNHGDRILRRLERDIFPWLGRARLPKSMPPNCWGHSAESKTGAPWKPLTGRCRTAGKFSATP